MSTSADALSARKQEVVVGKLNELMEGRYKSFNELAAKVLERWREREEPNIEPRGLGAKLSDLDRGKDGWWRKRRPVLADLASALDVDAADLLEDRVAAARSGAHVFPEFPELPPLDLAREEPAPLWTSEVSWDHEAIFSHRAKLLRWFEPSPHRRSPSGAWVVLPRGGGKTLAVAWYRARGTVAARTVRRLADAESELRALAPLVLEVEEGGDAADVALLASLDEKSVMGKLVLAPFALPVTEDRDLWRSWEREHGSLEQRSAGRLSNLWSRGHQTLAPDWRSRLGVWVERRLSGDTLFVASALEKWLQRFDGGQTIVRTPADFLFFARLMHEHGERWLARSSPDKILPVAIRDALARVESPSAAIGTWLEAHGVEVLRRATWRRLTRPYIAWSESLTSSVWRVLIPNKLLPSPALSETIDAQLVALVDATKKADRDKRAAEVRASLTARSAEAVAYLQRAGILTPSGSGYVMSPGWVEHYLALEQLGIMLRDNLEHWALVTSAHDRKALAIAALDRLDEPEVLALITRALALPWDSNARVILVEQLFALVARRMRATPRGSDPRYEALFVAQMQTLVQRYRNVPPAPWLRLGVGEQGDVGLAWLVDCWSWSLGPPDEAALLQQVPPAAQWLFPGWLASAAELPAVPDWAERFVSLPRKQDGKEAQVGVVFETLVGLGVGIAARLGARVCDIALCDPLVPGAVLQAARTTTERLEPLLQRVRDHRWLEGQLLAQLEVIPSGDSADVVAALWDGLCSLTPKGGASFEGYFELSELRRWLITRLSEAHFQSSLSRHHPRVIAWVPELPPNLRNVLARWLAEHQPASLVTYATHYVAWGVDDIDGLLLAANVGTQVHALVWRFDAKRALTALEAQLDARNDPASVLWVRAAPEAQLFDVTVAVMKRTPPLENTRLALVQALPHAGRHANLILAYLRQPAPTVPAPT